MMPDRDWIERHIPHKGSMCLLDGVTQWSEAEIVCRASSHRDPGNPLRGGDGSADGLGITAGIEYAAQAMAVHGALLDKDVAEARVGYLTSTRDVVWHVRTLSDISSDLTIRAERVSASAANVLYQFQLHGDDRLLLSGRATVILSAQA
jgi:predicted hotdog family 3-hydroxylacyl-ACP dehydratase